MTRGLDLLPYPCPFPLKVMGRNEAGFEACVLDIVTRHTGETDSLQVIRRPSGEGNYLALTVTLTAHSRDQLDAIYRDLSEESRVIATL